MSVQSKNHHPSDIQGTTVSQGSRADARAPSLSGREFASFGDEYDFLVNRKRDLEAKLSADHSKGARSRIQADVRRKFRNDQAKSLSEWLRTLGHLDEARALIVAEKAEVEKRMQLIKSRVLEERRQDSSDNPSPMSPVKAEQLDELKKIRLLLETLVERLCP